MAGKSSRYEILLTRGAEQDLESIHDYLSEFDCVTNANHGLDVNVGLKLTHFCRNRRSKSDPPRRPKT